MTRSVIVAGARTPMGRLLGSLKDFSGADLGGVAIKAALEQAGVAPDQVDYVIMGQVLQAGAGPDPRPPGRRQGRHPDDRPGADDQQGLPVRPRRDRAGRPADPRRRVRHRRRRRHGVDDQRAAPAAEEPRAATSTATSTMRRPHGLRRAVRTRSRPGDGRVDRARNAGDAGHHPRGAGRVLRAVAPAGRRGVEERAFRRRDRRRSRSRSARATRSSFRTDEGIRADTTAEALAKLRPAFGKDGTITAGSSSQISDGAAAVVVMSKAKAEELGLTWLAEIGAHGVVAGPDSTLQSQPANAIAKACAKEGIDARRPRPGRDQRGVRRGRHPSTRDLGLDPDKVNVNGGAIALGHPIGMSRRPARPAPRARAQAARRRRRRGGALRRRRPGRRADPPRARRLPEPAREPTPWRAGSATSPSSSRRRARGSTPRRSRG